MPVKLVAGVARRSVSAVMLGVAISPWIAVPGLPSLLITIIGRQFEYFRGNFAQ